jgi:hypothetical protein
MRPKVKFLTVVWGVAYIERFAGLALPSFLAPGNLPALAAATDLEVVIMTARADIEHFDAHATFQRLRAICAVRFIEIDDLITSGVYGVTLTLAYARPIIASGAGMLDTHFVFMNADFVLADGSLRGLARHILAGRSIVIAPSFRSTAEAVEPHLLAAVDNTAGTLAIAPRKLVDLALRHPHPTTLAKIVNLGFCHSVHPNQFFWQVDEHAMLGRYYLIFMLCLKPERVIDRIDSYCDYGFIPEMCPSGDTAVMADSDDFFMLELQGREQEMPLLYLGRASKAEIASSLNEWTTAEHRRSAKYDVVFHSQDIPAGVETARRDASAFISKIERRLEAPVPHSNHHYWIGGVESWRNRRLAQGLSATAVELDVTPRAFTPAYSADPPAAPPGRRTAMMIKSILIAVRNLILGRRPSVTMLHPDWLDYQLLEGALRSIQQSPAPCVLVVRVMHDLPDSRFGLDGHAQFAEPADVLAGKSNALPGAQGKFTHVMIYLFRKDCRLTRALLDKCRPAMAAGCVCHVFIHDHYSDFEVGDFSAELVRYFDDIILWPLQAARFSFAGGLLKRFNRQLFNIYGAHYARSGARALPFLVPAMLLTLPIVVLSNVYLSRNQRDGGFVPYCSSMLIRIVI